jgi:hypothetical protein
MSIGRPLTVAVGELDASLGAVQRQPLGRTPQTYGEHEPDVSAIAFDEQPVH